jgi:hypothetical protein
MFALVLLGRAQMPHIEPSAANGAGRYRRVSGTLFVELNLSVLRKDIAPSCPSLTLHAHETVDSDPDSKVRLTACLTRIAALNAIVVSEPL